MKFAILIIFLCLFVEKTTSAPTKTTPLMKTLPKVNRKTLLNQSSSNNDDFINDSIADFSKNISGYVNANGLFIYCSADKKLKSDHTWFGELDHFEAEKSTISTGESESSYVYIKNKPLKTYIAITADSNGVTINCSSDTKTDNTKLLIKKILNGYAIQYKTGWISFANGVAAYTEEFTYSCLIYAPFKFPKKIDITEAYDYKYCRGISGCDKGVFKFKDCGMYLSNRAEPSLTSVYLTVNHFIDNFVILSLERYYLSVSPDLQFSADKQYPTMFSLFRIRSLEPTNNEIVLETYGGKYLQCIAPDKPITLSDSINKYTKILGSDS